MKGKTAGELKQDVAQRYKEIVNMRCSEMYKLQ